MNALISSGIVAAVVTMLSGVVFALMQRRKLRAEVERIGADAASVITEAATGAVSLVTDQLKGLRTELVDARGEIAALRGHLRAVEDLLRRRGVPVPDFAWPSTNGVRGH